MKKLEKSIRRCMKQYGHALRNRHYGCPEIPGEYGGTVGAVPDDYGVVSRVCCDVEDGEVTDIRLYCFGDAMEPADYYRETIDITYPIFDYLSGNVNWDGLIQEIVSIIGIQETYT